MRKYTLDEIDRMRNIMHKLQTCEVYSDGSSYEWWATEKQLAAIENQLRTYLAAGIKPKELDKRWKKFLDEAHKHNITQFDDAI